MCFFTSRMFTSHQTLINCLVTFRQTRFFTNKRTNIFAFANDSCNPGIQIGIVLITLAVSSCDRAVMGNICKPKILTNCFWFRFYSALANMWHHSSGATDCCRSRSLERDWVTALSDKQTVMATDSIQWEWAKRVMCEVMCAFPSTGFNVPSPLFARTTKYCCALPYEVKYERNCLLAWTWDWTAMTRSDCCTALVGEVTPTLNGLLIINLFFFFFYKLFDVFFLLICL